MKESLVHLAAKVLSSDWSKNSFSCRSKSMSNRKFLKRNHYETFYRLFSLQGVVRDILEIKRQLQ